MPIEIILLHMVVILYLYMPCVNFLDVLFSSSLNVERP